MAAVAADDAATFSFDLTICLLNERGEHKLKADWEFLRTFRESIHKWSNADKVFAQKPISLALKIEALAEEIIAQDLTVGDYETKTKHLMAEIEEALDDHLRLILGGGQSFQVYFPASLPFWISFVDCLLLNLKSIKGIAELNISDQAYGLSDRLRFIRNYILKVIRDPKFPSSTTNDDDVVGIHACLTHVASVVLRVAVRCCHYWFSYKTDRIHRVVETSLLSELVSDLHDEINPANPNFMEFHLNFILALCESSGGIQVVQYFCGYLFDCEEGDFREEVSSLVTLFVNSSKLGKEDDVVKNFFPEINAVLVGMVSLFEAKCISRGDEMDNSPQCAELLTTICLLKTELYLMVLVRKMHNTTSFSDMLSDWTAIRFHFIEIPENLRRFSRELPYEKVEDGKKLLKFIELLAQEVESLFQSFRFKEITEFTAKNSLLLHHFKILSFKEEAFLLELFLKSSDAATFMAYGGKDQIAPLLHQLEYFTQILLNKRVKDREDISRAFVQIEIFARRMTCFYNSFLSNEITRDNLALSFSELLDKVKHVMKAKRKEISPPFPLSDFPRTFKLGFIDFLLRNLQELLQYDPESIAPFKDHIEEIQLQLKSLNPFLTKVSELDIDEHPELKDLGSCVINVAYNVEYVIDAMEVGAQWQDFFWFYDILEELKLVCEQVCRIHLTTFDVKVQDAKSINQVSLNMVSRYGTPSINDVVVDLSDEEQVIVDQLTRGSSRRVVVSIVGMPGIGKTTLARKVYNSENVKSHFHRRAWCTVSQVYEKRLLLLEILSYIHAPTDEIHQMNDEDLESKLRQCLLKNKYLIVMDDVWDVKPWNDLKSSFPDDGNRSRILITGRLCNVALEIEPDGDPHSLRLLSDDESWKLLEGKVFHGDSCPQELLAVGKEIAHHCKGLPLAIVAIAGLLERTEKSQNWWRRIAESLSSQIINDPETRCMEILELSYKHLPEYLKVCFLYLGVLLEDKDIPVSKLIRFWLAEGFIPKTETKSFEDVAEDCLMDLINRSLVIISKRRSNGKVKSCRLHDLILDFCRSKAKDENFLQLVTRCDTPYASFPSSDYGFEFDFYHHLCPVAFASYRLVIFLKRNHFFESRPSGPGTRSLVLFASTDSEPRCPYDISFICHSFKLLRVLDFECINVGVAFPVEIGLLIQLRYLAVSGYVRSIPQSIANLRKLETLIVKGLRGKIVLPNTIWRMTRLRHLHVNIHVALDMDDKEFGGCFELENLVSFSRPSLSCCKDTERMIKRLPNLSKLSCIFFESPDSSKDCKQFPRLNFLTHLESLKIFYYGRAVNTGEFILPLNLKELTLSSFRLPWDHISAIGRLPNLQVLKLLSAAFEGQIWDMREEEFQELKFLMLDCLNIAQWNASSDHLPKLERLVLQNCKDLEKIPYDFADITTLAIIEVHWCEQSAEESAKEIGGVTGEIEILISSSYKIS